MECTQRLDFESPQCEKICPEQIGFLGIIGTKYPVLRGPNKVGRDPQTCSIVLNLNSISRQHAVINVLNGKEYMLMDLDSANKTRLNNKVLQAYIPAPLSNGDTVQFGEVFGVFRLLEEDTELPATQAIDIPDTPVLSRTFKQRQATIPESPDISDRDDSFVVPSQPIPHRFKSPSDKYIKPSSKTISIQPIGTNKIDNVFWNSSKKSSSFNLDDSNASLNDSGAKYDIFEAETQLPKQNESTDSIYTAATQIPDLYPSIHSIDRQMPVPENLPAIRKVNEQHEMEIDLFANNKEKNIDIFNAEHADVNKQSIAENNDIFYANTQLPEHCNIFEAHTQMPGPSLHNRKDTNIFTAQTQLPKETNEAKTSKHDIFDANTQMPDPSLNKKRDSDIFTAQTQLPEVTNEANASKRDIFDANTQMPIKDTENNNIFSVNTQLPEGKFDVSIELKPNTSKEKNKEKLDRSDETILFDELEAQEFMEEFQSQPLIGPEMNLDNLEEDIPLSQPETVVDDEEKELTSNQSSESDIIRPLKRNIRIQSDGSDCDDIDMLPTQKIPPKSNEDDLTDCEEDFFDTENKKAEKNTARTATDNIDDLATQVITEDVKDALIEPTTSAVVENQKETSFEDLATQVIAEDVVDSCKTTNFEDMATQVIPSDDCERETSFEDLPTQVLDEDIPNKITDKIVPKISLETDSPFKIPLQTPMKVKRKENLKSTEKPKLPASPKVAINNDNDDKYYAATQDILEDLCTQRATSPEMVNSSPITVKSNAITSKSVERIEGNKSVQLENELSPTKKYLLDNSTDSIDEEEQANKFVANLSTKQIGDVIGVEVEKPKKVPSDPSDVEVTPKKLRPFNIFQTELPTSQEIKTSVPLSSFTPRHDDSVMLLCSESETDNDSQENTPIVFHKKKRVAKDVKKDLITKFDISALPTRIITRTRKPTVKVQENKAQNQSTNILKPKFLAEHDDDVDSELISDNITKLRNNDKKNKDAKDSTKTIEVKKDKIKVENLNAAKMATRRKNDKSKKKDNSVDLTEQKPSTTMVDLTIKKADSNNTVDLTNLDELRTEKRPCKSAENSPEVEAPTLRTRNRRRNDEKEVNKEIKVKEETIKVKIERPKSRGPRKTDSAKKKDIQEKITNYTITKQNDSTQEKNATVNDSLNTAETSRSTRTTRNRTKDSSSQETEKGSIPPENTKPRGRGRPRKDERKSDKEQKKESDTKKDNTVEKDNKRRRQKEDSQTEEQEVRRSRRQKTVKEGNSQNRTTHEQSTVYNISSESSIDSPKGLKRSATGDIPVPSKKAKSIISSVNSSDVASFSSGINSNSSSRRSTPSRSVRPYHVLFTAFPYEEIKAKLEELGAVVVGSPAQCSVAVTQQLRRTVKLLCCVGLGRPVVGPAWVQACVDNHALVDPWEYLLRDEANERRFQFSLARTLGGARGFLRGLSVSATPQVLPTAQEMRQIVECSGGTWKAGGPRWVVVSCRADSSLWPELRAKGASIVSSEFILTGVLRQEVDIEGTTLQ